MNKAGLLLLAALGFLMGLCFRCHAQTITFTASGQPVITYPPVKYFGWKAPHAALPSALQCAASIMQTPEGVPGNVAANAMVLKAAALAPFYSNPNGDAGVVLPPSDYATVTGNYAQMLGGVAPSTDMIIRWAACKWGVDEDTLRAQLWEESTWNESTAGDERFDLADCTQPGFNALWNGASCFQSWGISQEKIWYFTTEWGLTNASTAFSADVRAASTRGCINGDQIPYFKNNGTCNGADGSTCDTASGLTLDWDCVGSHFSGGWGDAGSLAYQADIKNWVTLKPWPGGL